MPYGQKNKKTHTHTIYHCAEGEHNEQPSMEFGLDEKEDDPVPSAGEDEVPTVTDTETTSSFQCAGSATSSVTLASILSNDEFISDEDDISEHEHQQFPTDFYMNGETSFKEALALESKVLEQFMLYKFKLKQQTMLEEMLTIINPCFEGLLPEILKSVSDHIEKVFAVQVKEVDPVLHTYDLVCKLKLPNNGRVRPGRGMPKTGLLMNVLGMIFMNGNSITEEELWEFLGMMRIYPDRKHRIYGHARKLLTQDLVHLQYLERRPIANTQPPLYEFLWGPKAYAETSKMKVLEFMAQINDKPASSFQPQYEEAVRDEEARSEAGYVSWAVSTSEARMIPVAQERPATAPVKYDASRSSF